jgi:hypothetical protein
VGLVIIILAPAVLPVLVTSPIGAIGISLYGEKVLEEEELSVYRFQTLRQKLSLPRVGQQVRHKVSGTIWKVIEEKEVWLPGKNQTPGAPQIVPAIHLRYWKPRPDQPLGKGKTLWHCYANGDYSLLSSLGNPGGVNLAAGLLTCGLNGTKLNKKRR